VSGDGDCQIPGHEPGWPRCITCARQELAEATGVALAKRTTEILGRIGPPPEDRAGNPAAIAEMVERYTLPSFRDADPGGFLQSCQVPRTDPEVQPEGGEEPTEVTLAQSLRARILTRDQLRNIPKAQYLIQNVLDLDSESWLIGESQAFKSFVAIDWACHVATDTQWRGRKVRAGTVLYVVAEGVKGFSKRIDAWEIAHGIKVENLLTLPAPVQAKGGGYDATVSEQWRALCEVAAELKPVLIVLDTQARMTVGLEENSNTAMGIWTEAVRLMREATSACVLVVHHVGRNGKDARGASALDGAQDTEWKAVRTDMRKLSGQLRMDKNKDGSNDQDFDFEAVVVELGLDEEGDPVTSLALRQISADLARHLRSEAEAEDADSFEGYDYAVKLTANQAEAMAVLREVVTERGETLPVILRLINERRRERAEKTGSEYAAMARTSLTRALESLETNGLIKPANKAGTRFVDAEKWVGPDLDDLGRAA